MYPLIFAGKPLFLQVLCDADCFHISVVWRYCCSGIYRCGLTGEGQDSWQCLPWLFCFPKTEQLRKGMFLSFRMIPIRVPLLLNFVLCGEMKTPGSRRMRLQTFVMNGTSLATQLSMIFSWRALMLKLFIVFRNPVCFMSVWLWRILRRKKRILLALLWFVLLNRNLKYRMLFHLMATEWMMCFV